ncbi:segregation/condensation protein A [Rossellomorea vietnamensis]|uniref:Segregation and condensation protein A n=1 Tax=Rossellomorea vietnamensis TaxID=218284 RepID=A0A5D4KJE2_9BACI|nr:segregation/condensation protein A [Rossellomorea vietnamensis]TYR76403.1 segregation/condensation protein A [Rossellomorea vietnamensis]
MEYNVKIDAFEGPLDLLLHLIHSLEVDIYDIPMAQITEQYLLYIHTMKKLELDVASEYLVMAATLLAIKSKMLLPKHEEIAQEEDFEVEEDPRDELVDRLIEYKRYKEAAEELKSREEERGRMYTKPPSDLSEYAEEKASGKLDQDVTIYDMLGAFNKLLRRKKLQKPVTTKITRQEIPIEKRMDEILTHIKGSKEKQSFFSLFPDEDREHIVVTFLAVLELMKRKQIIVRQEQNFDDFTVQSSEEAELVGNH